MSSSTSHFPQVSAEALAETAPDAIITIDPHSTILTANRAISRILGYTPDELVGRNLTVIIPERLRAAHENGLSNYLRTGHRNIPWTGYELPALHKDGHEVPVEISFGEFTLDDGRHVFSGFVRDVSERVRQRREVTEARATAESALRELHRVRRIIDAPLAMSRYDVLLDDLLARLRQEIEADAAAVLLIDDEEHLIIRASSGIGTKDPPLRIPVGTGLSGHVAASGEPLIVDDAHDSSIVPAMDERNARSVAAVPIRSDGAVIGVLLVGSGEPRRFEASNLQLLQLVAERTGGVLARARLFDELEKRTHDEQLLRSLAESITRAVEVGEVMRQIAEGALGISAALGAYVEQVIDENATVEVVAAAGENTPPVGQRVPFPGSLTEEIIRRGEPIFLARGEGVGKAMAPYLEQYCQGCSVMVAPVMAEGGLLGTLALLRKADEAEFDSDVVTRLRTLAGLASIALQRLTTLAESERRREEAEAAVRARDDVLSIVSHDLRNPVSTIAMSASLLGDEGMSLSGEQRRTQLGIIQRSAQRMNRLIQDLLDVGRIESGRLTIACKCESARALAAEACESFSTIAAEKRIRITADIDGVNHVRIKVDRDRVLQLLSNYLNNAFKFAGEGGRVQLIANRAKTGGILYAVSDSGPGIASEDLPHVFQRFWQSKRTAHLGSGLGLAIASGIARAHDGRVWAESTPGVKTTFYFELPQSSEC